MDPFGPISSATKQLVASLKGDMDAEYDTTQSCLETGCGGDDPWA